MAHATQNIIARRQKRSERTAKVVVSAKKPEPFRFSVAQYYRMGELGFFDSTPRTELIHGEIVMMPPTDPCHAHSTHSAQMEAIRVAAGSLDVRCQQPVRLDEHNEPMPDISIVTKRSYAKAHPGPQDVQLIIEIANSSLPEDLGRKRDLYARHGIKEYWVLDLTGRQLHLFIKPRAGQYREQRILAADQVATSTMVPKFSIKVGAMLP